MDWQSTLEKLKGDRGNWSKLAREIGVHVNTIRKIVSDNEAGTKHPRVDTAEKIANYYKRSTQ